MMRLSEWLRNGRMSLMSDRSYNDFFFLVQELLGVIFATRINCVRMRNNLSLLFCDMLPIDARIIYIYKKKILIGISKLPWILIALGSTTVHVILSFIVQTKEAK